MYKAKGVKSVYGKQVRLDNLYWIYNHPGLRLGEHILKYRVKNKVRSGEKNFFGVCVNNDIPNLYHKKLLVHVYYCTIIIKDIYICKTILLYVILLNYVFKE